MLSSMANIPVQTNIWDQDQTAPMRSGSVFIASKTSYSMPIHVLQYVIHAQKRSCTHLSFGTYVQKRRVIFVHA